MVMLIKYDRIQDLMSGIDHLLASSLEEIIRDKLGEKTVQKVERRLFEKHGISFTQSLEQFDKLDEVLREFFGKAALGLEKRFLNRMCVLKDTKGSNKPVMKISDKSVIDIVLRSFGDEDKKAILQATNSKSKIIYDILKETGIPQTSGYRKINSLIEEGLLVPTDSVITEDKKKIMKYMAVINNLRVNIRGNDINLEVHLNKEQIDQSTILQTVATP